jgi:hypothetical protein
MRLVAEAPPSVGGASGRPWVHVSAGPNGAVLCGDPVASFGHRVVADDGAVDGVFARWVWNGDRLVVEGDRYGLFPLFYWTGGRNLAVSPSLHELLTLGAPPDIDLDAVAVFLRLGFFVGEDTCFRAIRALPPGAVLAWTDGRLRVESRPPRSGQVVRSRREAVDGFVEGFRAAIARRLPHTGYVLPLSGGRDSRHIMLELARQCALPQLCVSGAKFPPDAGADTPVAGLVARALGVPHRSVGRPRSRLPAELLANAAQSLGTIEGAWALPLAAFLRDHTELTYDGIGGDLLSQASLGRLSQGIRFDPDRPEALAAGLIAAGRADTYLPLLLGPRLTRALSRARAVDRLTSELSRHSDAASAWTSFYFWNRTRRAMALGPYALLPDVATVYAPYLDRQLFDFLMSIPPELAGGDLHDEVISRAYPRYADLPFAPALSRHGPRYVCHRSGYLLDLLAYVATRRRDWWEAGDGMLPRLFGDIGSPKSLRTINRMAPLAVYLLQLWDTATSAARVTHRSR